MNSAPKGRNLVGIIPLSGWQDSFDCPWPDYLQPLSPGVLAVERSVLECAYAGCDSIWVVCNDNFAPLVKHKVGDYVMSPRFFKEMKFVKRPDYHQKWIPVYYTPISQKDRARRDSLGWSILHGALTSFQIASKVSRWVLPTKFYVSFPFGIYDPRIAQKHLNLIRGPESVYLMHNEKTVRNNEFLGFTFFPEDWPKFKWSIKNNCTGGSPGRPLKERWSSKDFTLDKIFNIDTIKIDNKLEVCDFYHLRTWESLQAFYTSGVKIPKPSKQFIKPYFMKKE